MGHRRCGLAALRVPPQSTAGHLYLQHRLPRRLSGVAVPLSSTSPAVPTSLSPEDYERARRILIRRDPVLGVAIKRIGACGMADRQRKDHLSALVGAIVSQQLSTKAAATIFGRFAALFPDHHIPGAEAIDAIDDATLRGVGLSGQKVGYLRDLCARIRDGRLQLDELETLSDE